MSLTTVRTGLQTRLATISGLRSSATVMPSISPPYAVVIPATQNYDTSFSRGLRTYEFVISLYVGEISDRSSQNNLDSYLDDSGAKSIKAAIEADKTLGGAAQTLQVTGWRNYGPRQIEEITYLAVDLSVTVYT